MPTHVIKILFPVFYLFATLNLVGQPTNIQKTVLSIERIWDRAGHNAFTDLVYFRDRWYCTFREGTGHVPGANGSIRVIISEDGQNWSSLALLSEPRVDLRDPKLSITPDDRLMLNFEAAFYEGRIVQKRESWVAFSDTTGTQFGPGRKITFPAEMTTDDDWLWRVSWIDGIGYGVIYQPRETEWDLRLLTTTDGLSYDLVTTFDIQGKPSEATLLQDARGQLIALVRRDGDDRIGMIGTSSPPYKSWNWNSLGARLGGPDFVELPDGRLLCATRDYSGNEHKTALAFFDTSGSFQTILTLPSGGDTSYPGMVVRNGILHVSYYSSHEGKTSIYLARLSVPELVKLP